MLILLLDLINYQCLVNDSNELILHQDIIDIDYRLNTDNLNKGCNKNCVFTENCY